MRQETFSSILSFLYVQMLQFPTMQSLRQNLKWYLLTALFLANTLIWHVVFAESRSGILTVAFLDVGQGDSIFIEAPNGSQVLIDGGPNKSVLRELSKVMPFYDRSIDIVIATHPDKDHIGGLPDVLELYEISTFIESGATSNTGVYNALTDAVTFNSVPQVAARRGMVIVLDEYRGIFLKILFPDRDVSKTNSNDASVIAQLVYGETEFLLTGDAPQKIEKYLVSLDGKNLESDVLKVGHHGSKTSTSELFLGFVSPKYTVISAGADNRYGHPHKEVLSILEKFNIPMVNTATAGTIIFTSDGEHVTVQK